MRRSIVLAALFGANLALAQQAENQPIDEAMKELFSESRTQQLLASDEPSYLRIVPSKTDERSTLIYRCRHVAAKSIADSLESATSPTGIVETSEEQNIITINDINDQMDELKELVLSMDVRGPQVLVEAKIVEVQMGDGSTWDSGLSVIYDGSSSAGMLLGGSKGYPSKGRYPDESGTWFDILATQDDLLDINARLHWLKTNNKAEILSSPNLLVDLGTTATVSTGTDQPLLNVSVNNGVSQESVYYKRTGVNLRVMPELINKDTVTLQVRPEVTSVVGYASLSASSEPPIISVRNIDTKLTVKDGGVVMMGGLYSSKDIDTGERVPVLSRIPLLGRLFKRSTTSKEQVQLIFLLKVTIVPDVLDNVFQDIDASKQETHGTGELLKQSIETKVSTEE